MYTVTPSRTAEAVTISGFSLYPTLSSNKTFLFGATKSVTVTGITVLSGEPCKETGLVTDTGLVWFEDATTGLVLHNDFPCGEDKVKLFQAHGAVVVAEALQDGAPGGEQPAAQAAGHAGVQVRTVTIR